MSCKSGRSALGLDRCGRKATNRWQSWQATRHQEHGQIMNGNSERLSHEATPLPSPSACSRLAAIAD